MKEGTVLFGEDRGAGILRMLVVLEYRTVLEHSRVHEDLIPFFVYR